MLDAYVEDYLRTRGELSEDDPLFTTTYSKPIARQALYKILAARQEDAKLPKGVHIFRHTFLTGTSKVSNARIAQQLANHSNVQTTQRCIHTTAEERRTSKESKP